MNAAALTKYWMTACDENRCVILNEIVNTGSLREARMIAESRVAEQYHGSICITNEDGSDIVEAAAVPHTDKPTLKLHEQRFMVSPCGFKADHFHMKDVAIKAPSWTDCTDMTDAEVNDLMVRRMNVPSQKAA